jgi:hypothetical protein
VLVPANSTVDFAVQFLPNWKEKALANVVLTNPNTSEKFSYSLKGRGEEPLAEDHLVFKCDVGETVEKVLEIRGKSGQKVTEYVVEFDMHGASGEKEVRVKENKVFLYKLSVLPTLGGIYAGSVTFRVKGEQEFFWYSVELESQGQRNTRDYELSSVIRKESYLEIPVENTFDEEMDFDVFIRAKHCTGPRALTIPAKSKATYTLTYLPLDLDPSEGSVSITNSKAGELFCRINFTPIEPKPQKVPLFKSEIGKFVFKEITLHNPSSKRVTVTSSLTNEVNFECVPPIFEIPPFSVHKARVKFIPSELDKENTSDLIFQSKSIGNWKFLIFGRGEIPTEFEEIKEIAMLKKEGSTVITFTNPFKTPIILQISLKTEKPEEDEVFELMNKKQKVSLHPQHSLRIPVTFFPMAISEYKAKVELKMTDKIKWVYPIRVVTEANMSYKELSIGVVCRKRKEKQFTVELPGVKDLAEQDEFDVQITQLRHVRLGVMRSWCEFNKHYNEVDLAKQSLTFTMRFTPQKPFKEVGVLTVSRKAGGIWR